MHTPLKTTQVIWITVAAVALFALSATVYLGSDSTRVAAPVSPESTKSTDQVQTPVTPKKTTTTQVPKTTVPESAPVYFKGVTSMSQLVMLDVDYRCSFSLKTPMREGTFYLGDKKWRGDFTNKVSMIHDGQYVYVWTAGSTQGLKALAKLSIAANRIINEGGIDPLAPLTHSCSAWTPEASRFALPSGVVFTEV